MIEHVFFLRHFETSNNAQNILNGRSINVPILEGRYFECEKSLDVILCSTALRCRQTINFYKNKNESKIIYLNELLERNMGDMEGHLRMEMRQSFPELFDEESFIVFSTPPKGEAYEVFYKRAMDFWKMCNHIYKGNILICSHNQTLKMLYFTLYGKTITMENWKKIKYPYGKIVQIM